MAKIPCLFGPELAPYQQETVDRAVPLLGKGPILAIVGPRGSGKTVIAGAVERPGWAEFGYNGRINLRYLKSEGFPDLLSVFEGTLERDLWRTRWMILVDDGEPQLRDAEKLGAVLRVMERHAYHDRHIVIELDAAIGVEKYLRHVAPEAQIVEVATPQLEDFRHVLTIALGKDAVENIDFEQVYEQRQRTSIKRLADIAAACVASGNCRPDTDTILRLIFQGDRLEGFCEKLVTLHERSWDAVHN